jgi:hypothetical protein
LLHSDFILQIQARWITILLSCTLFSLTFLSKLFIVKDEDEEHDDGYVNDDGNRVTFLFLNMLVSIKIYRIETIVKVI